MRASLRYCMALMALASAGCGGNSLTGGGVPVGRAIVEGTVINAVGIESPVSYADVTLEVDTSPITRTGIYRAATRTDSSGAFVFTGVPEGEATIRVTPPHGMRGMPAVARLHLQRGDTASFAAAIEPDAPDFAVASLTVNPQAVDTAVGVPVTLAASALQANGQNVRPSWIVEGGVGRISHRGRFLPLRAGSGQIRVRAGAQERVIPVTVRP